MSTHNFEQLSSRLVRIAGIAVALAAVYTLPVQAQSTTPPAAPPSAAPPAAPTTPPPPAAPSAVPQAEPAAPVAAPPPAAATATATTQVVPSQATPDPIPYASEPDAYSEYPYQPREQGFLRIGYSMAFPMGDLYDFTSTPSFRGFDVAMLWPVFQGLYLGAAFGFQGMYEEKSRETVQLDNGAITGKIYRYADAWQFVAAAQYHFLQAGSVVRPYAGIRVGVASYVTTTLLVDFSYDEAPAGFLLAPEVGVMFHMAEQLDSFVSYQFSWSTASADNFDELSLSALQLGLAFRFGRM